MAARDTVRAAVATSDAELFAEKEQPAETAADLKRAPPIETSLGQSPGAICVTNPRYRRATLAVAPPQTKDDGLAIRCCARRGAAAA